MKKMKKSMVSWPPDPMLCQVKLFLSEDCPAKVAFQPQNRSCLKQSSGKPQAPDLPPGFEGIHSAPKQKLSDIPRNKWRRPPKLILNDSWRVGAGEESTDRQTENLRIAKLLESIYPHRSAIPSRPSVSPDVEGECYDDSKTPIIRRTPIEDEWEAVQELSQTPPESDIPVNSESPLEPKPLSSTQEPAPVTVSGLGADVSLAASAVLTALMKSKEERSMIDPDLLVKFLSDPKIVQNLINDTTHNPPEAENPPVGTHINARLVPQSSSNSAIGRILQPIPLNQTFAASKPFTYPKPVRVSLPRSGNGDPDPHVGSMSIEPYMGVAVEPPQLKPSTLPPVLNLQKPPPAYGAFPVSSGTKLPHKTQHAFSTLPLNPHAVKALAETSRVVMPQSHAPFSSTTVSRSVGQPSVGPGTGPGPQPGPQLGFNAYQMNAKRVEAAVGQKSGVPLPVKSVDYFKNLIKEHGTNNVVAHETKNQYKLQTRAEISNVVEGGMRKPCMYFGSPRGCMLGDSCMFLHDVSKRWRAKRAKFGP